MNPELDNDYSIGTIVLYRAVTRKNLELTMKICVTIRKGGMSHSLAFTDGNGLCHFFSEIVWVMNEGV